MIDDCGHRFPVKSNLSYQSRLDAMLLIWQELDLKSKVSNENPTIQFREVNRKKKKKTSVI